MIKEMGQSDMRENKWKIIGSISAMILVIICIIAGVVAICEEDEVEGGEYISEETTVQKGEELELSIGKVCFFEFEYEEILLYIDEKGEGVSCEPLLKVISQGHKLEHVEATEIKRLLASQPFLDISARVTYNYDIVIGFSDDIRVNYMAIDLENREAHYTLEENGEVKTYRAYLRDSQIVYIKHLMEQNK